MSVNGGLVGPKARPKGVVDGQQVNIPALLFNHLDRKVYGSRKRTYYRWGDGACWTKLIKDLSSESKAACVGKSAQVLLSSWGKESRKGDNLVPCKLPRKASREIFQ